MSAPAPLRHYFAGDLETRRTCARPDCGREQNDAVHLTPGDDDAYHDAIRAASGGHATARTPEQDEAAIARATKRNADRWTFGTATTSANPGETVTVDLGRSTPPSAG